MGRWLPVATPRLGQRRRTQTAKLGCGNNNRACPMIPSARNREVWGLLAAEPAFAFAGTRSRSVAVRSGGCEPPFCQYGGWTVAAVRKTNNFLCLMTRPFIRTQKRPYCAPRGKTQAFLMLTFSDWRWLRQPIRCVQQHTTKEKSRVFMKYNLRFNNAGNPQKVCSAANLQETKKQPQSTSYAALPNRKTIFLIRRAWIHTKM